MVLIVKKKHFNIPILEISKKLTKHLYYYIIQQVLVLWLYLLGHLHALKDAANNNICIENKPTHPNENHPIHHPHRHPHVRRQYRLRPSDDPAKR